MIDKVKTGPLLCKVAIKDHQVVSDCMEKEHVYFMEHRCYPNIPWSKCACDLNYSHPAHTSFIQSANNLFNSKVPLFSQTTILDCFLGIVFPSFLRLLIPWSSFYSVGEKQVQTIWRKNSTGGLYYAFDECRSFQLNNLLDSVARFIIATPNSVGS